MSQLKRSFRLDLNAYARVAAVLMLITIPCGYFGELYVPTKIVVTNDAAATAANIASFAGFARLGFASYLVEAICDISLALVFYVLLKPVDKNIALLSAFFGLLATATYAGAETFFFGAIVVSRNIGALHGLSADQINTLVFLSLKMFGNAGWIFLAFYGIAGAIRGYLIYRSGYIPKLLGILLIIAGGGFIAKNFLFLLAPGYASDVLLMPMALAGIALMVWFFAKGVRTEEATNAVALRASGASDGA